MIKLHYQIADALDECLEMLDHNMEAHAPVKPRTSLLREKIKTLKEMEGETGKKFSLPPHMRSSDGPSKGESPQDGSVGSETSLSASI